MKANWFQRRPSSHSVGASASSEVRDAVTGRAESPRTAGKPGATTQMHQTPPGTGGPAGPFGMCVYPDGPIPAEPWYGGPTPTPPTPTPPGVYDPYGDEPW